MAKGQIKPKLNNPEVIKKLEEAFALDCTILEACFYADISSQTYYNIIEDKPELLDRFTALREKPVLMARQEVVKGFKGNPELALKYLERKRKNEFSTKSEVDQTLKGSLETNLNEEQMKLIANRVLNGKTSITNDTESE